jgi:hypothetical protein
MCPQSVFVLLLLPITSALYGIQFWQLPEYLAAGGWATAESLLSTWALAQ